MNAILTPLDKFLIGRDNLNIALYVTELESKQEPKPEIDIKEEWEKWCTKCDSKTINPMPDFS